MSATPAQPLSSSSSSSLSDGTRTDRPLRPGDLVVCGDRTVYVLDGQRLDEGAVVRWAWRAADRPELPPDIVRRMAVTDDCKPVDGGRQLLVTSSSGAAVVIDTADGRACFHATVPNAHSIERLPVGLLAIAASDEAEGNRVVLFDRQRSGVELTSVPLASAHGVVWDALRERLWALGRNELLELVLIDATSAMPKLQVRGRFVLPAPFPAGGHDLIGLPASPLLWLTTRHGCWQFDRDRRTFTPHPTLGGDAHIKSLSVMPGSDRLAMVKAGTPHWWTDHISLHNPDRVVPLPDERVYKARWVGP